MLVEDQLAYPGDILVDQGEADQFLASQLHPMHWPRRWLPAGND
jgi:hypothetical protein